MIKAIVATGLALAGFGALAIAQTGDTDDFEALPGGWHMHPSTCTVHHEEGDRYVSLFYAGMTADFEMSSPELAALARRGDTGLEFGVDGSWRPIPFAHAFEYGDGRWGYRIGMELDVLDAMRAGRRLQLRSRGRTIFDFDLTDAGAAIDATTNCYMASGGAGVDGDAEWGDNMIEYNRM